MKILLSAFLASSFMLSADTLYLRNGRTVEGTFISGNSQTIRFLPEGGQTENYNLSGVERLSFGNSQNSQGSLDNSGYDDRNRTNRNRTSRNDRYGSTERGSDARRSDREVPEGTQLTLRMIDSLNSNNTDVGKRYRASVDQDLVVGGQVVVPRGGDALVEVVRVDQARAISGREEIGLVLAELTVNGRRLNPVTQNAEISANSRGSENVKVIGGTAALGAIIGAIAGGGRGAAIGAASGAGAGAAVQAVRGQKIEVPSETQLLFTLSQPMRY